MQDYFIWNGTDCRHYGIHVTEQPPITIPAERSTQTNVPGRPGSLTQLEGDDPLPPASGFPPPGR